MGTGDRTIVYAYIFVYIHLYIFLICHINYMKSIIAMHIFVYYAQYTLYGLFFFFLNKLYGIRIQNATK